MDEGVISLNMDYIKSELDKTQMVRPEDVELRKWCLEQAFITRDLSGVGHMEVTNVAEKYYEWIISGTSQRSYLMGQINGVEDDEIK